MVFMILAGSSIFSTFLVAANVPDPITQGLEDAERVLDEYLSGLEQYDKGDSEDGTSMCVASFADR